MPHSPRNDLIHHKVTKATKKLLYFVMLCLALVGCRKEAPPAPAPQAPAIKNVLLISIDTLRPDALSIYGGKTPTPFFEDFAKRAVVFDRALTCAPLTLPAHTSLLTGLYPPTHGVRNNGTFHVPAAVTELSEVAKQNGLNTAAVVGGFPLAAQFGLNQGFDSYDDRFDPQETGSGTFLFAEKNAEAVRASAESWLSKNAGHPFFLWLHFFDPHHPYVDHGMKEASGYEQEVLFVDLQLANLFQFLQKNGWDRTTLMIITADHGEAFGEHGEISHSLFVYNTTLKIPLLIAAPQTKPGRVQELVRIIDVAPTVTDAMGWKVDKKMNGVSLVPLLEGKSSSPQEAYAETMAPALDFGWSPLFSIQDSKTKYIQAPRAEFYRLDSDPAENNNVIQDIQPAAYLAKIRKVMEQQGIRSETHTPTPEEREILGSLGYLSTGQKVERNAPDPKDKIEVARKIAELTAVSMSPAARAAAYAEIVEKEPQNPLLRLRYAEVLLELKKYEDAENHFKKVAELKYPSVDVYNGLAAAYFHLGKINEAEAALKEAVANHLANGETFYNLGEIEFNRGSREKAFQYYDSSMKLGYLLAFYRKARLAEVTGGSQEALKVLAKAEALSPQEGEVNYQKGMVYYRQNQLPQAIEEFKKSFQKNPTEVELLYNIGLAYSKSGDEPNAKEYMRRFLAVAPPKMKQERSTAAQVLQ